MLQILLLFSAYPSLLKVVQAKEQDNNNNNNNDNGDHDFEEANSIQICCSWGEKLADGSLTYKISGGNSGIQQAVRTAIEDWDSKIINLQLDEIRIIKALTSK
jgi:hypothetical protein